MPVVTIRLSRLEKLLGMRLEPRTLEDLFFRTKCNIEALEEDLLEVEVTSDRLDMLMSEGIARAIKGLLGVELGAPKYKTVSSGITIEVDESVLDVRPYVGISVIYGVKVDEELLEELIQVQEKLHVTIGRNRRRVAIGIHDLGKVPSTRLRYVALPPHGFSFTPLYGDREMTGAEILVSHEKGREYGWILAGKERVPVIMTEKGEVLAMPPIINSDLTRVEPGTEGLLIDVTGTDARTVLKVLDVITTTIAESGSAIGLVEVRGPLPYSKTPLLAVEQVRVNVRDVSKSIGVELSVGEVARLLLMSRYDVEVQGEDIVVTVPPFRHDILHPIDIIEDVAIAIGYNNIQPETPRTYTTGREMVKTSFMRVVRELMVGLGFQELLTYTLTSPYEQEEMMRLGKGSLSLVELANPVVPSMSCLRAWLLPRLVKAAAENQFEEHPIKLFELGEVAEVGVDDVVKYSLRLAASVLHYEAGFEDVHSALHALAEALGLSIELEPYSHPSFIEGRCAKVMVNGKPRGVIGEVHPEVLEKAGSHYPIAAFELDLTGLWEAHPR